MDELRRILLAGLPSLDPEKREKLARQLEIKIRRLEFRLITGGLADKTHAHQPVVQLK